MTLNIARYSGKHAKVHEEPIFLSFVKLLFFV